MHDLEDTPIRQIKMPETTNDTDLSPELMYLELLAAKHFLWKFIDMHERMERKSVKSDEYNIFIKELKEFLCSTTENKHKL